MLTTSEAARWLSEQLGYDVTEARVLTMVGFRMPCEIVDGVRFFNAAAILAWAKKNWGSQPTYREDMAVVVAGVHEGQITSNGAGVQRFPTLTAAQAVFPDLDLKRRSKRFFGPMAESAPDGTPRMRFETLACSDICGRG